MQIYCQLKDHKAILENQVAAQAKGYPLVEVEPAYDGSLWEKGFAPQKPLPTKEQQEQARASAYVSEIDPLHARKARKTILGEWTDDDETEYVAKVKELSAEIVARYPYPTDPIIEEVA